MTSICMMMMILLLLFKVATDFDNCNKFTFSFCDNALALTCHLKWLIHACDQKNLLLQYICYSQYHLLLHAFM